MKNLHLPLLPVLMFYLLSFSHEISASAVERPQAADAPVLLEFEQIASGLSAPVGIMSAGDGTSRLFIVLKGGQVVIYDGNQILPTPFLDVSSLVLSTGSEQGLLGIAFHPDYEHNGYFYVDYTKKPNGDTVTARYHVSANPNVADSASEVPLLTINQDFANHNGGQLAFGPDGYLYIGTGDGGSGGDPNNRAQSPNSLLGKLLRIDVDHGTPYGIPASNPFVSNSAVRDEIWAFGLRNPWRFSFDHLTGDLIIADVGQDSWEEINFQSNASSGGENYGWSCYEGTHVYNAGRNCTAYGNLTGPVLEYAHGPNDSIGCSVTGGYRYRGSRYPALEGIYLYADFCTGMIWGATRSGSTWTSSLLTDTSYAISSFGEDESGELYLASYSDGRIYHIAASGFADVSTSYWAQPFIERLYEAGITGGCGINPLRYCPDDIVTRAQMAVFLERGIKGATYAPPSATGTVFGDVPASFWAAAWIEQLADDGITGGCRAGIYCPDDAVTRAQMAVLLLKAKYGASFIPPAIGSSTGFNDVSSMNWAAAWINELAVEGITGGCGGGNYCPDNPVTRAQMAVFLVRTFNLP